MTDKPLLAYLVTEDDEGTGGVVFARSSAEARREGSSRFGDGDFNWGRAVRAPGLDRYAADGHVPWKAMFEMGWWRECSGCGVRIAQDEEDEDGELIKFNLVEVGSAVYCTPECRERKLADDAESDRIKAWIVGYMTDRLLRAMPGALVINDPARCLPHVYVPNGPNPRAPQQVVLHFLFPGSRYGGDFRFDKIGQKPRVEVACGDLAAFSAWKMAGYPPHMMDASEAA